MSDYLHEETTFKDKIENQEKLNEHFQKDFKKNLEFRRWLIFLAVISYV